MITVQSQRLLPMFIAPIVSDSDEQAPARVFQEGNGATCGAPGNWQPHLLYEASCASSAMVSAAIAPRLQAGGEKCA